MYVHGLAYVSPLSPAAQLSVFSREPKCSQLKERSQYADHPNYCQLEPPEDRNPLQHTVAREGKQCEKGKLVLYKFWVMRKGRKIEKKSVVKSKKGGRQKKKECCLVQRNTGMQCLTTSAEVPPAPACVDSCRVRKNETKATLEG